jgi:putative ABC transport system ATP-binding protein
MIDIKNLSKTYFNGTYVYALKGINISIEKSDFISIMGPSGCGKSTLLNILGLLDSYDTGTYCFNDILLKNIKEKDAALFRNEMIGFVFQSFNLIEYKNALDNVGLPLYYKKYEEYHDCARLCRSQSMNRSKIQGYNRMSRKRSCLKSRNTASFPQKRESPANR